MIRPTEADDLARRADALAGEGFDTMDENAREWIHDTATSGYPEEVEALVIAACADNEDDLRAAINRLRERYVVFACDLYRVQARDEMRAAEEFVSEWP